MITDQTAKRDRNRYGLLRLLQRKGSQRRGELSKASGVRISSVINLTDELVAEGILELREPDRPRSPLAFTSDRWFVAVAAVMADRIEFARVGLDGRVESHILRRGISPECSSIALQVALREGLEAVRSSCPGRLFGMGVSLVGIVDPGNGLWHSAIHFPNIHRVPLASTLSQALDAPVLLENNARASLWGALWFEPRLAALRNVVYISLCSGIGSALLIEGRLHTGTHFWAGELGHMRAGEEGRECCCGKTDCLETYCAMPALGLELSRVMPSLGSSPSPLDLADAIRKNPVAANVADRAMARLGRQVGTLAAYVDPDAILLGEQEPTLYEALLPSLRRHIASEFQGRGADELPIELVAAPEYASLRGMAAMVIHEAFRNTLSPLFRDHPIFTGAPQARQGGDL
jgi:glucokinase